MGRIANIAGALGLAAAVTAGSLADVQAQAKKTESVQSPEYGMNIFIWGNPSTTDRDLGLMRNAGFSWQKTLFQWREIEGEAKGRFNWTEADRVVTASKAAGVKIIARVDFNPYWARADRAHNGPPDNTQDFADFVTALISRYNRDSAIGRIQAIEIWNEPNIDKEWGGQPINQQSAVDYVRLLKAGYTAAKAADPSVQVVTGGLSPTCTDNNTARPDDVYLQWMYDAGAKDYFDVLGAHGAGYDKPPSASPQESADKHSGCRAFTFRRVEDLRDVMVSNNDADKQVWLLEFGWTTDQVNPAYSWHAVSPQTQGEYLVGAYRWAHQNWAPWIGVMTLWTFPDPNWSPAREEYWWAITEPDGSARPAYQRLAAARAAGELP
ncbi:MAG: cellulase family glycosylhydrolase [Chloroflexota bacterium]